METATLEGGKREGSEYIANAYLDCMTQLQPLCGRMAKLAERAGLNIGDSADTATYSHAYDACHKHLIEKRREELDSDFIESLQVELSNLDVEARGIMMAAAGAVLGYLLTGRKDSDYDGAALPENMKESAIAVDNFWAALEEFGAKEPRLTHEVILRFLGFSSFDEEERVRLMFEIYGAACDKTTVDGVDADLLKRTLVNSIASARAAALSR